MKEVGNISLPGGVPAAETQPMLSVPAPRAESTSVSVTASQSGVYRVCGHFSDFFCTIKSELVRAVRAVRSFFRPGRMTLAPAPAACCGYSRTILGWRL